MVAPTPTTAPCSAAITGLLDAKILRVTRVAGSTYPPLESSSGSMSRPPPDRSMPTQKSLPAPVRTTTRTSPSASARPNASASSSAICTVYPLRASGRLRVSVATRPATAYVISWYDMTASLATYCHYVNKPVRWPTFPAECGLAHIDAVRQAEITNLEAVVVHEPAPDHVR